jgi:hypothetical protein
VRSGFTWPRIDPVTESRGRVAKNSASYSGPPGFNLGPEAFCSD